MRKVDGDTVGTEVGLTRFTVAGFESQNVAAFMRIIDVPVGLV